MTMYYSFHYPLTTTSTPFYCIAKSVAPIILKPPYSLTHLHSTSISFSPSLSSSPISKKLVFAASSVGPTTPVNEVELPRGLQREAMPQHVAVIMDGNVRWAKQRGLPSSAGHAAGSKALTGFVALCQKMGIKVLSIFAFSSDNWLRSNESGAPSQTSRKGFKIRPSIPKPKEKRPKIDYGEEKNREKSDENKLDGGDTSPSAVAKLAKADFTPILVRGSKAALNINVPREEIEGRLLTTPNAMAGIPAKVRDTGTSHQEAKNNVPLGPLTGLAEIDRAKEVKDMVKSVSPEYSQALRGFNKSFISPIQQDLADELLRLEDAKTWPTRMVEDVRESHKEVEEMADKAMHSTLRIDHLSKVTIDAQAESILKLKKDCDTYLHHLTKLVDERDNARKERDEAQAQAVMVTEEVCALKVILSEKEAIEEELGAKLKAKTKEFKELELARLDNALAIEELMKNKVKIAWEQAFPEGDYSWFAKYVDWADLKVEAENRGKTPPPPPVEPEEDVDNSEDDVTS